MRIFQLLYAAPISVGHRVELIWYRRPVFTGFLIEPLSQPHEPLVRDLETGVEYGPYWLFHDGSFINIEEAVPFRTEVRPDLEREFNLIGRVLSCRIVSLRSRLQTVLNVEPEEERGVYR